MTKKTTSDRVSRIAAKVLAALDYPSSIPVFIMGLHCGFSVGDLRSLAASALGQDETKGRRRANKKARKP